MKVSLKWLQGYFGAPLPDASAVADAFTFHSFEVEEREGDLLDLKVLPDRAGYGLCHRGIAYELSAVLGMPLAKDPLREPLPVFPKTDELAVEIADPKKCPRYMGALVRGAKVGPSPAWLKEALESVGQRSINNVVDATNYVMLDIGQPMHAFDASKLQHKDGKCRIVVRSARNGECVELLHNYVQVRGGIEAGNSRKALLSVDELVIADANADAVIGIAGIKGGTPAAITEATKDIIIESANFDGPSIRRAAHALKLFTDASLRFQNRPSPEVAAYGIRDALALILDIAGGELAGVVDERSALAQPKPVKVPLARINAVLGSDYAKEEAAGVFERLALPFKMDGDTCVISPPFWRADLAIPEDVAEEVGRIIGYDRLAAQELPALSGSPDQRRFRGIERMKDQLVEQGFTEVSTQSFAEKGDVVLANPLDKTMPALRTSLEGGLQDALARAKEYAPLVLPPEGKPKLFEVGSVFPQSGEYMELRMTETVPAWGENFPTHDNLSAAKLEDYGGEYAPKRYVLGAYKPFSAYPYIVRDVAAWVQSDTDEEEVLAMMRKEAGELCVRTSLFDRFEKGEKVSLAFRLIFQSFDRTLTDDEANAAMEKIYAALRAQGFEIR